MMSQLRRAFVALGANLGDRETALLSAARRLSKVPEIHDLELSRLYETKPVGVANQPDFLNAAATFQTTLNPEDLLNVLLEVEREFGRLRHIRWGPRTLDLDLLWYEGELRNTPELSLPHPGLSERAFVVVPLRDLMRNSCVQASTSTELRRMLEAPIATAGIQVYTPDNRGSAKPRV